MTRYGPKVSLKAERPESKRVYITDAEASRLVAGLRDRLFGVSKWDKYHKMLDNALAALVAGRRWLTAKQYGYAKVITEEYEKNAHN